ncbi:DUF2164 domain-containing protein [Piscibacillus halophilus]|uniref:DUF2164 domain-containing protein n=1 Tax=Piscibacillus halophilus TaxID=571933 RepID=UPI00158EF7F5|nr:DUF2164 domain-containing protein [Piscibacillus halophilus]
MFNIKPEQKRQMLEQVKSFFYEERAEEIGEIAAERFLEFMMEELGPHFYNLGLEEAKNIVEEKITNLDEDILALERPTK